MNMNVGEIVILRSDENNAAQRLMTVIALLEGGWIWVEWTTEKGAREQGSYPPETLMKI